MSRIVIIVTNGAIVKTTSESSGKCEAGAVEVEVRISRHHFSTYPESHS